MLGQPRWGNDRSESGFSLLSDRAPGRGVIRMAGSPKRVSQTPMELQTRRRPSVPAPTRRLWRMTSKCRSCPAATADQPKRTSTSIQMVRPSASSTEMRMNRASYPTLVSSQPPAAKPSWKVAG
jgi:hypothetical protein